MTQKLFCEECGNEVQVGEQTDYDECIEYRDNRGGIVCEQCEGRMMGFAGAMVLPRKQSEATS